MLLSRVTTAAQPVAVSQALDHLRQPQDSLGYVQTVLAAAAALVGEKAGRVLGTETWDLSVAEATRDIRLPKSPVQSITSISYYDADGVSQSAVVSDYHLFKDTDRAIVRPKAGISWPTLQDREDALTIRFVAGYTTLPAELHHAILLTLGHLFEHRSAVDDTAMTDLPMGVDALVAVHRIGWIAA